MEVDYLVVGAGLTGATVARRLADAGRDVVVVDRRPHAAGNVHDHTHPSGIRINSHGPHYFRTSSDRVWAYSTRFARFRPYEARVVSVAGGDDPVPWPLPADHLRRVVGPHWAPRSPAGAANFEEAAQALMPRVVYERYVKGYTEKQWGVPATALAAGLCRRFSVHQDGETRLTPTAKYQGMPVDGYAAWVGAMLAGIPVVLNYDYLARRHDITARKCLVFTGPVDEFFGFDLGRLTYRGQRRAHEYRPDVRGFALPAAQVNTPDPDIPAVRTLEWKQMMDPAVAARITGTVLTTETPYTPTDPDAYEYPFPDDTFARLCLAYRRRAAALPRTLVCGRLGEGTYLDMDQAIARALLHADRLLGAGPADRSPEAES